MISLLLIVFLLQLFIHLVNTVGAPVITEFVHIAYCFLHKRYSPLTSYLAMATLQQTPDFNIQRRPITKRTFEGITTVETGYECYELAGSICEMGEDQEDS